MNSLKESSAQSRDCHEMPGYYCNIFPGKWQCQIEEENRTKAALLFFSALLGVFIPVVELSFFYQGTFVFVSNMACLAAIYIAVLFGLLEFTEES